MEGQRIGLGGVQHNIIIIQFKFQLSRVKYNSYLKVASFSLENGRWPQGLQIEILKFKSNVPAKPLFITVNIQRKFKTRMQKEIQGKKFRLYTLRLAPHTVPFCIFKTSAAEF